VLSSKIRFCNGDSDAHLTPATAYAQTLAASPIRQRRQLRKVIIIVGLFFTGLVLLFYFIASQSDKRLYRQVATDFANKYPTYQLIDCAVGEGDGAVAYVHVRFKRTIDEEEQEEIWQYWNTADNGWLHRDKFLELKERNERSD
jgi:hypothetical protein